MKDESISQLKRRKIRFAKKLRRNMTEAEKVLWNEVRGKKLVGLKFRRQVPISAYIVDFLCVEKELILEIDGGIHEQQKEHDIFREQELQRRGYSILRFTNEEVTSDTEKVLQKIREVV